jgi:hypothetical protein
MLRSAEYGKGKIRILIKIGIPPVWIGATSQGLILKRNFWNFRHPPLLIPWDKTVARYAPAGSRMKFSEDNVVMKTGSMLGGTLCEIRVVDPEILMYTQMEAAQIVVRELGPKFKRKGGY